jgi:hypothetical protein
VSDEPPIDLQEDSQTVSPEVVGRFADRDSFKSAVEDLRAAGFERSDLSVLDTRESLSASESAGEAWGETLAGLIGEVKYTPHTEEFARALENGAVLLWVRAETDERQVVAHNVLVRHGAADVHRHLREIDA